MDVTPRELRDIDIKEGFRGYSREEVDDLLERAAVTIEGLETRLRQLGEQVAGYESGASRTRETEETLQRTLVLAQRTADQTVAEAEERAASTIAAAEAQAHQLVTESERNSKRVAEAERHKLEVDVLDLGARRDALVADIEGLERFDAEYRSRLREALQEEIDALASRSSVPTSPRPKLHEVELPKLSEMMSAPPPPPPPPPPAPAPVPPAPAPPARASGGADPSGAPAAAGPPTVELNQIEAYERAARGDEAPPPPAPARSSAFAHVAGGEPLASGGFQEAPRPDPGSPVAPQVLDDDAFFASLREAVRGDEEADDAELGGRQPEEGGRFGNVFKRRR